MASSTKLALRLVPQRFRTRLILLFALLGAFTLSLNLGVSYWYQYARMSDNLRQQVKTQIRVILPQLAEALLFDDMYDAYSLARGVLDNNSHLENVYLLDRQHQVLLSAKGGRQKPPHWERLQGGDFPEQLGNLFFFLIELNQQKLGQVILEVKPQELQSLIRQQLGRLLWINLFILVAGVGLGAWLGHRISRPLHLMAEKLNHADFKDLPLELQLPMGSSSELVLLTQSLNQLSHRLLLAMEGLQQSERQLAQSQKLASLGTLAAGLAHELKNPVMSIRLLSQKLVRDMPQGKSAQDCLVIQKEAIRLVERVNDFLEYAKPVALSPGPVALSQLLERLELYVQERFGQLVRLHCRMEGNLVVWADLAKLEQVFFALVHNGVEAGANQVDLQFFTQNGRIIAWVGDNGASLTPESRLKAFLPFFTTKKSGTGLGLAICEKLLEAQEASIQVAPCLGETIKFQITFKEAKDGKDPDHR